MSVDDKSFPSKSFEFSSDCLHIASMHRLLRLAKPVDINNSDEIVKFVVSAKISGLPNTSLCDFTISTNAEDCVINLVEILAWISHAACYGKTLTQWSSCNINKWNFRDGMSFNDGVFKSKRHQLFLSDGSSSVKSRIQNGSWMSLWKD